MNRFIYFICLLIFTSCEEVIDIDLNSSDPRVVIQADLNDLTSAQTILVSRTVDFDNPVTFSPVINAKVTVSDNKGKSYVFDYVSSSQSYVNKSFKPVAERIYRLDIVIGDEVYSSETSMPKYIDVDSIGLVEDEMFGDEKYYYVNLKFDDPANQNNYYKYNISVNENPIFEFSNVFNDKFNDGLFVTHQLYDADNSLALGDSVTVIRSIITDKVYKYWNEFKSVNPGNSAPANPTSNISNGALGYFSVASARKYGFRIRFN